MEKATKQIVFRATEDQYDFLKKQAEEQDRTMAKVLRRIIDNEKEKESSKKMRQN